MIGIIFVISTDYVGGKKLYKELNTCISDTSCFVAKVQLQWWSMGITLISLIEVSFLFEFIINKETISWKESVLIMI